MTRYAGRGWVPPLVAALVMGPAMFGRGFMLVGDMVFVPEQPWKAAWTGADGGVPRAVPGDAAISLLSQLVPGAVLQRIILFAILSAAGWGVLRLTRDLPAPAALAGAVLFVWNPYVYERLAIGHWALLCGYAALPWVVAAALTLSASLGPADRASRWRSQLANWSRLVVPLGVAGVASPTGGAMTGLLAVGVMATASAGSWAQRVVRLGQGALVVGTLNLPWILPGILNASPLAPDAGGAAAFAAAPDTAYGLAVSLVTGGGIWKESVHPVDRGTVVLGTLSLVVALIALAGVWRGLKRDPHDAPGGVSTALRGVWLPAVGLFLMTVLLSTGAGQSVAEWLIVEVPGGGLLRDTHKWLGPWLLLLALGLSQVVAGYAGGGRAQRMSPVPRAASLAAIAVLPILCLPTLGWGLVGRLSPAAYPADWKVVAARMQASAPTSLGVEDRVVILPFTVYRRFAWNQDRAVLDPAPRFFPGRVLVDDSLSLGTSTVRGESPEAERMRLAIAAGEPLGPVLSDLGIRWVVTERGTPGGGVLEPGAGRVEFDGAHLQLVELPQSRPARLAEFGRLYLVVDGLVGALVILCASNALLASIRAYTGRARTGRGFGL